MKGLKGMCREHDWLVESRITYDFFKILSKVRLRTKMLANFKGRQPLVVLEQLLCTLDQGVRFWENGVIVEEVAVSIATFKSTRKRRSAGTEFRA